jgi:hypothetical protein
MLNFSSYTGHELQNFLSMLNQCEANGVTDIRFVREKIYTHIQKTMLEGRIKSVKDRHKYPRVRRNNRPEQYKLCPSRS